MNVRRAACLFAVLTCVCLSGCLRDPRTDSYIESLNAEKRALEDLIYDLEYDYNMLEKELSAYRGDERSRDAAPRRSSDPSPDTDRGQPERREDPQFDPFQPDDGDLMPPAVNPGIEDNPTVDPERFDPEANDPANPAPPTELDPGDFVPPAQRGGEGAGGDLLPSPDLNNLRGSLDDEVSHIVLNTSYTGGIELNDQPGDDGISVLIEPRNAAHQFVAEAQPITVVLVDSSQPGKPVRVARWDVDAHEARQRLSTERSSQGIHLRLPFRGRPVATRNLTLHVRYHAGARQLDSHRMLSLRAVEQFSNRWTPRTHREGVATVVRRPERSKVVPATAEVDIEPDDVPKDVPEAAVEPAPIRPAKDARRLPARSVHLEKPTWKPYR